MQCDFKAVRDKFTEERSKEMHQSSSVFKAYIEEFKNHQRKQTDNLARVETCNYIYLQRLTKSLYDAY